MDPSISVIIPTHNRVDLLPRAIDSVLRQDIERFELIVVNDGSTDDTETVLANMTDPRIRMLSSSGIGAAGARNLGVEHATARLVAFLDDDDEYLPGFLAEMTTAFGCLPASVGFGWCGVRWNIGMTGAGRSTREEIWAPKFSSRREAYRSLLLRRQVGTNCGLTVRRRAFEEIGGFDTSLTKTEDTDLLIRLSRRFDFHVVEKILVNIYLHEGPHLRTYDRRSADDYAVIVGKHQALLREEPRLWAALRYKQGWLRYHGGESREGRRLLLDVLKRHPTHLRTWVALVLLEGGGRHGPRLHAAASRFTRRLRRIVLRS